MMYNSVLNENSDSFIEKKSEFIGYAAPVNSEDDALEFISKIKTLNKDATHNCHAYIIGEDKLIQRFSDDGEPSGTAGIPILEVLKREDLTNLCVVVTRYYGGIKLGGGGLIRAYSKGAKIAIDSARIVSMREFIKLDASVNYEISGKVTNYLNNNEIKILDTVYTDEVTYKLLILLDDLDSIKSDLINLTSAEVNFIDGVKSFMPTIDGKLV